jgi:hypothetical protein
MFPATEIADFSLATPDQTDPTVLAELKHLGGAMDISLLLLRTAHEYLDRYTAKDEHETPIFHGGTHFRASAQDEKVTSAQESLDVVESYATSLTLMLAVLSFARTFQESVTDLVVKQDVARLSGRASRRLTAAMVGLLRSFTVSVFEGDSDFGKALMRTANQQAMPDRQLITELRQALQPVMTGLREVNIGSGQHKSFVGANRLFECGWSWGVIHGTEPIQFPDKAGSPDAGHQPAGVAADEPYLYFTTVALDAIADLFSDRVRRANLLNEEQQRLARVLQVRWDLTQQYWSVLASFGSGRWPLEDVPWAATDNIESDYLTALVASISMRDLVLKQANESDLDRVGKVLTELSNRGRITRRPMKRDNAIKRLHDPGFRLELNVHPDLTSVPKSEEMADGLLEPKLLWPIQDYAAVLLKRSVRVATLFTDTQLQASMIGLGDLLWDHLRGRRFARGKAANLWDQPNRAYGDLATGEYDTPSWQMTIRVVESLVIAAGLAASDPPRSDILDVDARHMISEAERLLDKELLRGPDQAGPSMRRAIQDAEVTLSRARQIVDKTPGTAIALVVQVLVELDRLTAAREDSMWAR